MKRIPRVRNMVGHGDRAVANQFEIFTDDGVYFQSYSTIITYQSNGKVTLDRYNWDYSTTTGKYRNIFLGEKKSETERKIKTAARVKFPGHRLYTFFEHGHWWLRFEDAEETRTFDVVDCGDADGNDYFDFEEV